MPKPNTPPTANDDTPEGWTKTMLDDWKECRLGDVALVIDSLHKTPVYSSSGLPMIRVTDVKPGIIDINNANKVSAEVFNEFSRKYKPAIGDLLITRVGSYGITAHVRNQTDFCFCQKYSSYPTT